MTAVETSLALQKRCRSLLSVLLSAVYTFFLSGNSVTILEVSTGQVFYFTICFFFSRMISVSTVLAMKPRTSCPTIGLNISYSFFSSVFYYFINTLIILSTFYVCRHVCYRAYVVALYFFHVDTSWGLNSVIRASRRHLYPLSYLPRLNFCF